VSFDLTEDAVKDFIAKQVELVRLIIKYLELREWDDVFDVIIGGVLQETAQSVFCWRDSKVFHWKDIKKRTESKGGEHYSEDLATTLFPFFSLISSSFALLFFLNV